MSSLNYISIFGITIQNIFTFPAMIDTCNFLTGANPWFFQTEICKNVNDLGNSSKITEYLQSS